MVKQEAPCDVTKSTDSSLRSLHAVWFALPFALFYQSTGFILLNKYVVLEISGVVDITSLESLPHLNLRSTIKIFKCAKNKTLSVSMNE